MAKKPKELHSVGAVLEALGGNRRAAQLAGRSTRPDQHASNWRREGRFPSNSFLVMTAELQKLGFQASPKFWGMYEPKTPLRAAS